MFTLFEQLLLLSVHEAKGTFIALPMDRLKPGLVGAILAELALLGKIQTSDNHRLQLIDDSPTNDVVLDEALGILKETEKERKFGYWIDVLGKKTDRIRKRITENLVQKGIFTRDEDRLAWVIPTSYQAGVKASAKYLLLNRLRGIVLAQEDYQPRDIVLLSLIRACGLLDLVFLSDERKLAGKYINEQFFSQAIVDPVIQTIQEIETVIAAAVEED